MPQFVQESLATIRRRLGYLVYRDRFLFDTVVSATTSTVTLAKAKRLSNKKLSGTILYVLTGAGAGQSVNIQDNTVGTGVVTITPTFGVTPSASDAVEIWPDGAEPEQINQYINMALLSVQHISIPVKATPTIAGDRLSVTIDPTWTKIARLTYKTSDGSRVTLRPRVPLDPIKSELIFTVVDQTLELDYSIPTDATNVQVVGYRPPTFLTSDSDLAEVRSDYLMYKAASLLAASDAEGPTLDPQNHSAKSLTWLREASNILPLITMQHLSNTHMVEQFV